MTAAGWHADPMGRHEHRYWDGTAWTDDVADGGVAAKDPLAPAPAPTAASPTDSTTDLDAVLEACLADHLATLEAAGLPEHPNVELMTALSVGKNVLAVLVLDPTRAEAFGISFPDDPAGDRLRAASVLHQRVADLEPGRLGAGVRALAFHVLMALAGDEASRVACAAALDEPATERDVAAGLGEVFFGVFDPPAPERDLMQTLYQHTPGLGWDPAYLHHLHQWLADTLLAETDVALPADAENLLWGVTRGVFQPYALAVFPDLAG